LQPPIQLQIFVSGYFSHAYKTNRCSNKTEREENGKDSFWNLELVVVKHVCEEKGLFKSPCGSSNQEHVYNEQEYSNRPSSWFSALESWQQQWQSMLVPCT
jgi:hypothetical protein